MHNFIVWINKTAQVHRVRLPLKIEYRFHFVSWYHREWSLLKVGTKGRTDRHTFGAILCISFSLPCWQFKLIATRFRSYLLYLDCIQYFTNGWYFSFSTVCLLNTCSSNATIPLFHIDCNLTCNLARLGNGSCTIGPDNSNPHCVCDNLPGEALSQYVITLILGTQCITVCDTNIACLTCGFTTGKCISPQPGDYACLCS